MRRGRASGLLAMLMAIMVSWAGGRTQRVAAQTETCFPETGFCLSGRFRSYWEQNGGLAVFGFPIGPVQAEPNRDTGQQYLTQWFERARFELHPKQEPPYDVLLGRLGDDRLRQQSRDWNDEPKASDPIAGCQWFAETRHNVCDQAPNLGFRTYLLRHGLNFDHNDAVSPQESLALFGLPLTEPRMETNASGDTVLTQWFERARLEWHPHHPDRFKVLLGLLGREVRANQLAGQCSTIAPELRRTYEEGRIPGGATYRETLGCPLAVFRDVRAAEQTFENGTMVWNAPYSRTFSLLPTIHVVIHGTYPMRYAASIDRWTEDQPETAGQTPPPGMYEPRRGFGKVWREEPGLRDRLGWATQLEREDLATVVELESGRVIWLQGNDLVYVFVYTSGLMNVGPRLH